MMAKVGELPSWVITLVIVAMVAAVGITIVIETKDAIQATGNVTTNPIGYQINATLDEGVTAAGDVTGWLGIVIIVVMGAIVIRLLMSAFSGRE
jgi:hypothetical protein